MGKTTVHHEIVSGYEFGVTGCKEQHRVRNVLRSQNDALQPRVLRAELLQLLILQPVRRAR